MSLVHDAVNCEFNKNEHIQFIWRILTSIDKLQILQNIIWHQNNLNDNWSILKRFKIQILCNRDNKYSFWRIHFKAVFKIL